MAYHSSENDFADNEERREALERNRNLSLPPDTGSSAASKSLLAVWRPRLCELATDSKIDHRVTDATELEFYARGARLVFKPTSSGIYASTTDAIRSGPSGPIRDLDSAEQALRNVFGL